MNFRMVRLGLKERILIQHDMIMDVAEYKLEEPRQRLDFGEVTLQEAQRRLKQKTGREQLGQKWVI